MDPNETLRRLLELARQVDFDAVQRVGVDNDDFVPIQEYEYVLGQAQEMSELIAALNNWICKGGFLPNQWAKSKKKVRRM